ncbi:hypothetical protein A2291_05565 [candidate division WOR-1 bacterium RIFOXYB2_FULL_42_35]|uniref:Uncharacterized protein n=1 Tax=candidate division WOR-1 bacterium RIFOXYC2_FULL_41_25 TaxID=1802586 RepID=A0A1F4TNS3_UNCSA|nr:MAG: hypothetical protein A2247_00335 [candidate division WOR-1 bacterium RIFOXYA2_FULL_41_14]OGC24803.1 MAG: hypothetical protein A2291_05565 [candidate division WOR-1 bacterium RIFOXYB2_FULL_42_35]OGC34362.1 MAG: hypothetical protein A2462_07895 [candidate division WOR-1 bacterium RIFOXYC2_FULL_41_25]
MVQKTRNLFDPASKQPSLILYTGNDQWVEPNIIKARECLVSDKLPEADPGCEYCGYRKDAREYE